MIDMIFVLWCSSARSGEAFATKIMQTMSPLWNTASAILVLVNTEY